MKRKSKTESARRAIDAALLYFKEHERDLPWRRDVDPYKVFVSEVMLQQTTVERVIPKFEAFVGAFPTWESLARASFAEVLHLWAGLGYNRRAKHLLQAARIVAREWGGTLPENRALIESLPGVGPYTSAAILAFAFNRPVLCIETNIRTVLIHHCYPTAPSVSDNELLALLEPVVSMHQPRPLYSALMDYGAYLKRSGVRLNSKSKGYVKQKTFEGSLRQVRGRVLRALLEGPKNVRVLATEGAAERVNEALAALEREGLVSRQGKKYSLA